MGKGYEKMDNNMVTGLYHCAVLELHNDALIAQFHQEPGRRKKRANMSVKSDSRRPHPRFSNLQNSQYVNVKGMMKNIPYHQSKPPIVSQLNQVLFSEKHPKSMAPPDESHDFQSPSLPFRGSLQPQTHPVR